MGGSPIEATLPDTLVMGESEQGGGHIEFQAKRKGNEGKGDQIECQPTDLMLRLERSAVPYICIYIYTHIHLFIYLCVCGHGHMKFEEGKDLIGGDGKAAHT